MMPRFDSFCIVCAEQFTYVVLAASYEERAAWFAKTDRLAAHCPACDNMSVVLFGEKFLGEPMKRRSEKLC